MTRPNEKLGLTGEQKGSADGHSKFGSAAASHHREHEPADDEHPETSK